MFLSCHFSLQSLTLLSQSSNNCPPHLDANETSRMTRQQAFQGRQRAIKLLLVLCTTMRNGSPINEVTQKRKNQLYYDFFLFCRKQKKSFLLRQMKVFIKRSFLFKAEWMNTKSKDFTWFCYILSLIFSLSFLCCKNRRRSESLENSQVFSVIFQTKLINLLSPIDANIL